ncbi:Fructosamine-3-kinase [Salinibacillus kushneri]|uniref:Fructosamine-3-kinase n=1 Tax=Salinibacillus kushneri TaxID=237682 RepID=A0A1I0CQ31_9BACI|nr:fructosamine kinase family protein [Salinibacillus kushneri]SET21861.1 Fructosamine-3-kinase [Salinibacillus kushneri]
MKDFFKKILKQHHQPTSIRTIHPVSGGSINDAYYVETDERAFFIKTNTNIPSHFFQVEATGLQLIEESNTIDVPHVYGYNHPDSNETGYLILDWIEGNALSKTNEQLGHSLAKMHRSEGEKYGLNQDTFIGALTQPNEEYNDWLTYYRNHRLWPQYEQGLQKGRMPGSRRKKMEALLEQLDRWVPASPAPSLLHGDLWGGNWITGPQGRPYLIDPSVLYGDHLFEIAFTEVFGGFSPEFYRAYNERFPLPEYYEDVKPLYQLYYLLVHLNLFGEGYGGSVDRILNRYIG